MLEILVAICALLLPAALAASVPALAWAYADGGAPARFAVVRVAISLALLGIPAAAMGATFPIAAGWFARNAADTGALYAVNTAGAALGAIAAGFFLIPAIGLRATTWIGVLLNLVAAAGAWWLAITITIRRNRGDRKDRRGFFFEKQEEQNRFCAVSAVSAVSAVPSDRRPAPCWPAPRRRSPASPRSSTKSPGRGCSRWSSARPPTRSRRWRRRSSAGWRWDPRSAAGLRGGSSGPRSGWRRMLVVSALAASGAAWVAAIADAAGRRRAGRRSGRGVRDGDRHAGVRHRAAAAADDARARRDLSARARGGRRPPSRLRRFGGPGPVDATRRIGRDAARVYTANTVGAIAGALAAGFALIPALGLRLTFQTAAIIGALGGAACLAAALRERRTTNREPRTSEQSAAQSFGVRRSAFVVPAAVAIAAVAAILSLPGWDRELLASGAYKYAPYLGTGIFDAVLRAGTLEYYKEGAAATVSVRRLTGTTSLAIDGKVDASNAGDMLTQRMLGLLPILIHGNAARHLHHRPRQRRDARLGARARHRPARRRRRDFAGGGRGVALLRSRERRRAGETRRPPDRRRRTIAPAADAEAATTSSCRSRRTRGWPASRRSSPESSSRRRARG